MLDFYGNYPQPPPVEREERLKAWLERHAQFGRFLRTLAFFAVAAKCVNGEIHITDNQFSSTTGVSISASDTASMEARLSELAVRIPPMMEQPMPTHLRKPTGPHGVDSFYIGSEYTQVRVPRRFKLSDVEYQFRDLKFDTKLETVTVGDDEYYGRNTTKGVVYLSPPIMTWAKVTVPSEATLTKHPLFQDVRSPWLTDHVEEAAVIFGEKMPFSGDTAIKADFDALNMTTLWPPEKSTATREDLINMWQNTAATPSDIVTQVRLAMRLADTPSTFRVAGYDLLAGSSTVAHYKTGVDSHIWSKKHGYVTPAVYTVPAPPSLDPTVCTDVQMVLTRGRYPLEVSFTFNNQTYTSPADEKLCLFLGLDYDYTMINSYGDGWNGAEVSFTFTTNEQVILRTIFVRGTAQTGTLSVPTELDIQRTKVYNADYDLNDMYAPEGGKVPIVFTAFEPEAQQVDAEELASWGIASVAHETIYQYEHFRSTTYSNVSLRDAMEDPKMGANYYPYVLRSRSHVDNFFMKASDTGGAAHSGWNNEMWTMPWNYNKDMSTTGTDSNDMSADVYTKLLRLLDTATDKNGVRLNTKLDLNSLGIHAWSRGGHIIGGADKLNDGRVKASSSYDMSFAMNSWPGGWNGASEGFDQPKIFPKLNAGPTELRFGTDGFSHPHMFYEPDFDDSYSVGGTRSAVGNRLNIQQTLRRTSTAIRQKCMFVELPRLSHFIFPPDIDSLYRNNVKHPEAPSLTPTNDPIFGIRDFDLAAAEYNYKIYSMNSLWYRHFLLGTVSLASVQMVGMRTDLGPWDIPGAHDYTWEFRTPEWENDWGADFKVYTDEGKLYFKDLENDKTVDVMKMAADVESMMRHLLNETLDL